MLEHRITRREALKAGAAVARRQGYRIIFRRKSGTGW